MMNVEEPLPPETAEKVMVSVPTGATIDQLFAYHPPTDETIPKYRAVRKMGLAFAQTIDECCPAGPDKSAAIRKVREAVMTANAAIACCGTARNPTPDTGANSKSSQ